MGNWTITPVVERIDVDHEQGIIEVYPTGTRTMIVIKVDLEDQRDRREHARPFQFWVNGPEDQIIKDFIDGKPTDERDGWAEFTSELIYKEFR